MHSNWQHGRRSASYQQRRPEHATGTEGDRRRRGGRGISTRCHAGRPAGGGAAMVTRCTGFAQRHNHARREPAPAAAGPKFGGVIKESAKDSKTYWPPRVVPPKGAPNMLLIMTDDQGYGVSGTFGGVIPTPAMDRIAKAGLRYTQFHSTALCSPTRAALITGRNHHSVGFGVIGEMSTGFPGYDSVIGEDSATIGKILQDNGYATSWFGKNHNTPHLPVRPVRPLRPMAIGDGLPILLRLHGRRDRPVDAVPVQAITARSSRGSERRTTTSSPTWRTRPSSI